MRAGRPRGRPMTHVDAGGGRAELVAGQLLLRVDARLHRLRRGQVGLPERARQARLPGGGAGGGVMGGVTGSWVGSRGMDRDMGTWGWGQG